jgi:aspartyl-tRNA(Asn)/glutamyl-tRNA(Gln) amidotransferase subunit B
LLRELSASSAHGESALSVKDAPIGPAHIAELVQLIDNGVITKQIGKDVFTEMYKTGTMPKEIVEKQGLQQSDNSDEIEALCREAITSNAKAVSQFKEGNVKALNALKGPVMKATKGKANPAILDQIIKDLISQM